MKKVLAFGASSSSRSINRQLAQYAAGLLPNVEVRFLDLRDYELPLFSIDREEAEGIPEKARRFKEAIAEADGVLISLAEHNGSYTAVFKNLIDWASRLPGSLWQDKPLLLLATSPGKRGARSVLEQAATRFPHMGGRVVARFSLPSFEQNFHPETGIAEPGLRQDFEAALSEFVQALLEVKEKEEEPSS
ncbi:MAG: NADPH-dependent oxidoreductase [Bacteroidetes bacterium]|nr:MAG: NADPH-dependent oxidoreductase [Bacteroidota bacterium]